MRITAAATLAVLLLTAAGAADAQDKGAEGRGAMLYSTFCVACHTTQMHWREKKIARDIPTLRAQVIRWQGNAGQNWDANDLEEVVRHLNRTYYKFPGGTDKG
jgi:mono/diheme cytochrome c family protein